MDDYNSGRADCKTLIVHDEIVDLVRKTTPEEERLLDLADFFKLFGDTSRMKLLYALFISEMCVCDLAAVTGISRSAVSHQLRSLRQANLVKFRREGRSAFYSLSDNHVRSIVELGKEHIEEGK